MPFSPWLIVAILLLLGSATGGGYVKGRSDEKATQTTKELLIKETAEAVQLATAKEIQKVEIKHVTIKRQIEREIREKPVYSACAHSPDGLRLANQALTNGKPAGNSQLSGESR